jgi:hypothetical protein
MRFWLEGFSKIPRNGVLQKSLATDFTVMFEKNSNSENRIIVHEKESRYG